MKVVGALSYMTPFFVVKLIGFSRGAFRWDFSLVCTVMLVLVDVGI